MSKHCYRIGLMIIAVLLCSSLVLAAASPVTIQKSRFSQNSQKLRIVLDLDRTTDFEAVLEQYPLRLLIEVPANLGKNALPQTTFNDPFVDSLQLTQVEPGRARIIVNLKQMVMYNVFVLKAPNRLVIDLTKIYEQKTEREVSPGLKHISWLRGQFFGPVQAQILIVDPQYGFFLKPVLSNGAIEGLDTLSAMSAENQATAAVNGSYFNSNGEIIGLLKINGDIISTPSITRTAMGIMPDGQVVFDQVAYQGSVTLPDGATVAIDGVNRERGPNEVIVYNSHYGPRTNTNVYGIEYLLAADGRILSTSTGNSPLAADTVVLSAHGEAVKALQGLKTGDCVKIAQSLGQVWDKTLHVLGAGPMLVKDGSVYLTTKTENFGSDVAGGRAPRTAVGITKDGKLLLVVVDGRQPTSAGLSLLEMAVFMQELGAVEAMNLDGGGSSEMVINDKVLNSPSDGRERKVGDALVVMAAKLAN